MTQQELEKRFGWVLNIVFYAVAGLIVMTVFVAAYGTPEDFEIYKYNLTHPSSNTEEYFALKHKEHVDFTEVDIDDILYAFDQNPGRVKDVLVGQLVKIVDGHISSMTTNGVMVRGNIAAYTGGISSNKVHKKDRQVIAALRNLSTNQYVTVYGKITNVDSLWIYIDIDKIEPAAMSYEYSLKKQETFAYKKMNEILEK